MKNILEAIDKYRMSGIVSPLSSGNYVKLLREEVDDLSLSFISPLSTDDNYI